MAAFFRHLFHGFYFDGIQVNIAGENGKVFVFVHEHAFVPALVQVSYAVVPSIVIACIGDIELAHEFGKVAFGGL